MDLLKTTKQVNEDVSFRIEEDKDMIIVFYYLKNKFVGSFVYSKHSKTSHDQNNIIPVFNEYNKTKSIFPRNF